MRSIYKKLLNIANADKIEIIPNTNNDSAYALLKCGQYTLPMFSSFDVEVKAMFEAIETMCITLERYIVFLKKSLESGDSDNMFSFKDFKDVGTLIMTSPTSKVHCSNNLCEYIEIVAKADHYKNFEDINLSEYAYIYTISLSNFTDASKKYTVRGVKHEVLKNTNSNS